VEVTLYIGNLSASTNEEEIETLFEQVGQVIRLRLQRDPHSGMSRGFGYLTMSAQSEADHAVSRLNDLLFHGNRLKVSLARRRNASEAPRSWFGR
jgi:cold-inducible RNA-binding protein